MTTTFIDNICWEHPHAPALADSRSRISYGELRDLIAAVAQKITAAHGRGNYVALKATPDTTFVVTLLATMLSGKHSDSR